MTARTDRTGTAGLSSAGDPADGKQTSRWLRGHVPGEPGIWLFIFGDMCVFAVFFAVFLRARMQEPALFAQSRPELSIALGTVNTVVLLTSSLCVALGVRAYRRSERTTAVRLFTGAMGCGAGFLVIKLVEYATKLAAGITPATNTFFLYYFIFTAIHAVHVVLGLGGLTVLRAFAGKHTRGVHDLRVVEIGATFWHMVDLLWIVLFPLFYLAS
ncbi:cytochrome c oxidase subunit 3 family protein [Amycolatopsis acidicola]|uniref:Cytochrome aa3 subunit 3 n=1 Tax=Amycolatopsis acidicola TaxID=2596893 RepID=A0A5N0V514_9PSEU|nr:cytochrome c oxidase subunit 3 family protein [Amycolatopsis acidicola]KAA9160468.1 cytochrome c oxidase subunit 3 family protein [Amycolatopsis acidicola]